MALAPQKNKKKKKQMAFVTIIIITGIITPGQFDTASWKGARNANLLVGTKGEKRLHKWKGEICPVFHRQQDFAYTGANRFCSAKNYLFHNNRPKDQEIGWHKKGDLQGITKGGRNPS